MQHTIEDVLNDEVLELVTRKILESEDKTVYSFTLKSLQSKKREVDKALKNVMKAIEAGIITPTTKERLQELEAQQKSLAVAIRKEAMTQHDLSYVQIMFCLGNSKKEVWNLSLSVRLLLMCL